MDICQKVVPDIQKANVTYAWGEDPMSFDKFMSGPLSTALDRTVKEMPGTNTATKMSACTQYAVLCASPGMFDSCLCARVCLCACVYLCARVCCVYVCAGRLQRDLIGMPSSASKQQKAAPAKKKDAPQIKQEKPRQLSKKQQKAEQKRKERVRPWVAIVCMCIHGTVTHLAHGLCDVCSPLTTLM